MTVQSVPTAGAVGSDQTICSGDDPVAFISTTAGSGDGTVSYRWESSIDTGKTWTTITGATTAIYDVPAGLTKTSQYRRITLSTLNTVACESKATAALNIKVNPLPTATAYSNSPVCTRGKLSLKSNGGFSYKWFGPNGYTSTLQDNLIYNADSNFLGNYTVWVTDTNQCKDDFTIKVDVKPGFRVSAKDNSPVCSGDTLKLFANISSYNKSTYSFDWDAKSFYSNVQNPVVKMVDSSRDGQYRIVVKSANGCIDTAYTTPNILRPPKLKLIANSPECVGQKGLLYNAFKTASSVVWTKPDKQTVTADTLVLPSLKLTDAGRYKLQIKDARGCRNEDSIKYVVHGLPNISVSGDTQLCSGSNLNLYVKGAKNYVWTGPNNFLNYAASPTRIKVTMPDSGLYSVLGIDSNLCKDTAYYLVKVHPAIPGLKIFGDSQVCLWQSLTLNTISTTKKYRYQWRTPNGETYYKAKLVLPLNKYSYEGRYSVVVSDSGFFCSDSVVKDILVGPRPMSSKSNSPVCAGDSLKLSALGNPRWKWQWSGPQLFNSKSTAPSIPYVTTSYAGIYTLIGTDTLGCQDTFQESVKINDCLTIELFADSVSCKGLSSGIARVNASRGSGSYQFKWLTTPARFNDSLINVPAGIYTVVVTDLITGYVKMDSVKVGEPAAVLAASITIDPLLCRDSSTAQLHTLVTGGTKLYKYKWNNKVALDSSVLVKVGAGTHYVVVTDKRGCKDTVEVKVANPARWNFSIARNDVLCAGGKTGNATVTVSGGKPVYFYQWDTITWISKNKTIGNTYKNLKAGLYKVLVTDANRCQQSDTVMIAQPDSLKAKFKIDTYIRCFGDTSGQITATARGGTGVYNYLWNNNKKYTDKTAKNLAAGWYVLQLRDANSCLTKDSIFLAQPDDIKIQIAKLINLNCYKDKSGFAEVSVSGGTTPHYVKWDNGGYTAQGYTKNNLDAGNHWVYIRDFQGCYDTLKITVAQPDSLITLFKKRQNVLCYNGNSGWAEFELAGGTPPYRYVWENGDTVKRSTKLLAQSYWVRSTDAHGCLHTDTIQLTQPAELDIYVKKTDSVSCNGFSDGLAEIAAVGGKLPYGFWYYTGNDTIRGTTLKGVPARQIPFKYDAYVLDANGCMDYTPVYIKEPAKLQVQRNGQVDLICYGARTASISIGPKGGNGGYTYNWNSLPKQYTPTASKLKAGNYIVTLKDYKGCTALDTFTVKQPAKNPVLTKNQVAFCYNSAIQLGAYQYEADSVWWFGPNKILLSKAYPNYVKTNAVFADSGQYTLMARDKQGCYDTTKIAVVINKLPNVIAWIQQNPPHCKSDTITLRSRGAVTYNWVGPNGFTSGVQNPSISGLTLSMGGLYYVRGTDANTCQSWDSVKLNIEDNINISNDQQLCAGANLILAGYGAEKYRWSGPNGYSSTLQSPLITDIEDSMSGKFTLYAVDKYGCKDTLTTHVLVYPRPVIKPVATEPVCAGEPLHLYSNGGGNYQYLWQGPLGYSSADPNPKVSTSSDKQSGTYRMFASYQADATNVCKDSAKVSARVFAVPQSKFMLTPQASVYLTETEYELKDFSTAANRWTYYLNNQYWSSNPITTFNRNDAGSLIVKQVVSSKDFSVYSGKFCMDSSQQVFNIAYKPKTWLPNAFTPNNNNNNDFFYPTTVSITSYRLRIYDRWGNKIFDEVNGKWNGLDKQGNYYPVGVYGVYLNYTDITGLEKEMKGNVTLLR